MSRTPVLSVAAVMLLSACASASPQADIATEEQAVRAVSSRWLELEKAKDGAGIAGLFADDGVMYRPEQDPIVGHAAIQAHLSKGFTERPQETSDWTTDRVDVAASGDLAVEHGSWATTGTPDGDDRGWYVTEYRKVGTEWKVMADVAISTKPAAPAAPAPPPAN